MRRRVLLLAVLGSLAVSCTAGGESSSDDGRLRIVTTVSPITNIVSNVVGDLASVEGVVPEGENSHEFEPAPSVARNLAEADLVFVNGLSLETPTIELAQAQLEEGAELIELGPRTVSPDEYIFDFSFPREAGDPNPHLWTNPLYGQRFAEIVAEEVARRDPANAEEYRRNLDRFSSRVEDLDAALRSATETVPQGRRKLLTYHDSFPYFAREYGWSVLGAIQPSDFSEPSPREMADLIEQIRAEDVPAIFGSEVYPSPVLEQIARESGARYVDNLRDDDLPGEPGDENHSWLGLMVFDYTTIVEALGGDSSDLDGVDTTNVAADNAVYA